MHSLLNIKLEIDSLAQLVEHNTFNVGVMGSSPMRVTVSEKDFPLREVLFSYGSGNRKLLPLQGDSPTYETTQGDALGCELLPFQGVWSKPANSSRPNGENLRPERAKAPCPGQHPGDKQQANLRPERAKAPSPGQHPGINSKQACALKGQKL